MFVSIRFRLIYIKHISTCLIAVIVDIFHKVVYIVLYKRCYISVIFFVVIIILLFYCRYRYLQPHSLYTYRQIFSVRVFIIALCLAECFLEVISIIQHIYLGPRVRPCCVHSSVHVFSLYLELRTATLLIYRLFVLYIYEHIPYILYIPVERADVVRRRFDLIFIHKRYKNISFNITY
ncbi:MAG: hypothetical protein ACFNUH_06710 [Bacteroidota bacterium]